MVFWNNPVPRYLLSLFTLGQVILYKSLGKSSILEDYLLLGWGAWISAVCMNADSPVPASPGGDDPLGPRLLPGLTQAGFMGSEFVPFIRPTPW